MAYGRGDGLGLSAGLLAAVFIAVGVGLAGVMVAGGFVEAEIVDRRVTVTGVAEREVKGDLAVWTLGVSASAADLAAAQAGIDADVAAVTAFLAGAGFDEAEFSLGELSLAEAGVTRVTETGTAPAQGYRLEQPIIVRSRNVDLVAQVSRQLGELTRQGVAVTTATSPAYLYTRISEIETDLLDEATLAARETAQRFADQSGVQLGGVRDALHGELEILPRDPAPDAREAEALFKRVRMTSVVTYQLES